MQLNGHLYNNFITGGTQSNFTHRVSQNATTASQPVTVKVIVDKVQEEGKNSSTENKGKILGLKPIILAGTIAGTVIPMIITKSIQHKGLMNIHYGLKEILLIGSGSVVGGLLGGIINDKGKDTWNKIKEANFRIITNLIVPTVIVNRLLALSDKIQNPKAKILAKAASVVAGVMGGMQIGSKIATKLNNDVIPYGRKCDRKLGKSDYCVQVDDLPIALTMSNVKFVDKILPLAFMINGYEAGNTHVHQNKSEIIS